MSGGLSVGRQDFLRELVSRPPHPSPLCGCAKVSQRGEGTSETALDRKLLGEGWEIDGPPVIGQKGEVLSGPRVVEANV